MPALSTSTTDQPMGIGRRSRDKSIATDAGYKPLRVGMIEHNDKCRERLAVGTVTNSESIEMLRLRDYSFPLETTEEMSAKKFFHRPESFKPCDAFDLQPSTTQPWCGQRGYVEVHLAIQSRRAMDGSDARMGSLPTPTITSSM